MSSVISPYAKICEAVLKCAYDITLERTFGFFPSVHAQPTRERSSDNKRIIDIGFFMGILFFK